MIQFAHAKNTLNIPTGDGILWTYTYPITFSNAVLYYNLFTTSAYLISCIEEDRSLTSVVYRIRSMKSENNTTINHQYCLSIGY